MHPADAGRLKVQREPANVGAVLTADGARRMALTLYVFVSGGRRTADGGRRWHLRGMCLSVADGGRRVQVHQSSHRIGETVFFAAGRSRPKVGFLLHHFVLLLLGS